MRVEPEPRFVLHEHSAKHHHFDLRLEQGCVLVSWAVPKGLPEKSGERRLAIAVDDHNVEYLGFEGTIPEGQYGAGEVKVSDTGTFVPLEWTEDRIGVILHGRAHQGRYTLIRFPNGGENAWLIVKSHVA